MFLLALLHSAFAIIQFHAGGNLNPLVTDGPIAGNIFRFLQV